MDAINACLIYVNIALAVVLIVSSAAYIYRFRNYLTWIKGLYIFVGIYCLAIYLVILFCDPVPGIVDMVLRPGITIILGTMASGALFRLLVERNT